MQSQAIDAAVSATSDQGLSGPRRALAGLAALALALLPLATAPAAAQDPDPTRVFRDPLVAGDFIQYSEDSISPAPKYLSGLAQLEQLYGDVIDVDPIGDLVGMPGVKSVGGREIPVVTVTDESVSDARKVDLYISMSIHGLERAGLEGGVRFIEDIARGWTAEQDGGAPYMLANGNPERPYYREMTATQVLKAARLVFVDLNPDGWAAGDRRPGTEVSFKRGNDNVYDDDPLGVGPLCCVDLNRQWPTLGYSRSDREQYKTLNEPEAKAGHKLIEEYLGVPEGAADLHGELDDNVLLAIMFPAGQFDPRGLAQQVELADSIKYNVNHSVFPGAAGALSDTNDAVYPAEYHTAYDAIGYDDAGFQGDYLVQRGILEMDHEYILSNAAPNSLFVPALEQVHVDTTRELLKATIVTTIQAEKITYTADLGGKAAYVENARVLRHTDAGVPDPPFGFAQKPYASTSMQYYRDLAKYTKAPLEPISAAEVADGATLTDLDTVVVTNRHGQSAAFWKSLEDFARDGGNVVLTDAALKGLVDLGIVDAGTVGQVKQEAGKIDEPDRDHPLLRNVTGIVGQTYFEVPLGYPFPHGDIDDQAPAWRVNTAAWEAAGGTTAATIGEGDTALGTVQLGDGKVSIFGAILPDASQKFPHTQGLADYAVTYAGNAILVNAMTAGQVVDPGDGGNGGGAGGGSGGGAGGGSGGAGTGGLGGSGAGGSGLPATGGGLSLLGIAVLAGGVALRGRLRR